jgi:hypothetical protein
VAGNDSYDYAPQGNANGWFVATLTIQDNDSGTYDYVQAVTSPVHGDMWYEAPSFKYKPHHNGYFTDSFKYELRNTSTGKISTATVYITQRCNTTFQCY